MTDEQPQSTECLVALLQRGGLCAFSQEAVADEVVAREFKYHEPRFVRVLRVPPGPKSVAG